MFAQIQDTDWYADMLYKWASTLPEITGQKVLELGCGPGRLVQRLENSGATVTGLDTSSAMLSQARRLKSAESLKAEFILGDAYHTPFPDNSFDILLAASLVNIVDEPENLITEMVRTTAPNGRISILIPTPDMNFDKVTRFIDTNKLSGFAAAVLHVWAGRAPKMESSSVVALLEKQPLDQIHTQMLLDGMVASVTAVKMTQDVQ